MRDIDHSENVSGLNVFRNLGLSVSRDCTANIKTTALTVNGMNVH